MGRNGKTKAVLYNPAAVFFDMPLALLSIGSMLDPARYEVVIVDGRLESDPKRRIADEVEDALCLGVTVLTGKPILDAVEVTRAANAANQN